MTLCFNSNILVTIIVPVYNCNSELTHCLNSILSQTFTNWELLLIDDGSIDGSSQICDNYSAKDPRIKTFHKTNCGVSSARNSGLEKASGYWITFIDSDDYIEKDFLITLLNSAKDSTIDLVISSYKIKTPSETINKKYITGVFNLDESFTTQKKIYFSNVWAKLIKKEIITKYNLKFDENVFIAEDLLFMLQYLTHVNKIKFIDSLGYNYIKSNQSLSNRRRTFEDTWYIYEKLKETVFNATQSKIVNYYFGCVVESAQEVALRAMYDKSPNGVIQQRKNLIDYSIFKKYKANKTFRDKILRGVLLMRMPWLYILLSKVFNSIEYRLFKK